MTKSLVLASVLALGVSGGAFAFHKDGHIPFPGAPSGKFTLVPIAAGATCTDPIVEPEGVDVTVHGGPKKFGFIGAEELELVVISEDPDVVQICFLDETPRERDVQVRISFTPEDEEPV
jgi:hypothetical protein